MNIKEVYFDTNVYTHLYHASQGHSLKNSCGLLRSHFDCLIRLLRSDRLRILPSYINFEETVTAILSDEKEAFSRLKLIRRLANRKRIIKYHTQLIQEDIQSFAYLKSLKSRFEAMPSDVKKLLIEGSKNNKQELFQVAEATKKQINEIRTNQNLNLSKFKELPEFKEIIARGDYEKKSPSFEEFWKSTAKVIAEIMADNCGVLAACKERGIDKLLKIKSVRSATFISAAQFHKNLFNKDGSVGKGDGQDAQHFLLSSVTDCFITHDVNFRKLLSKMDFPEIQVMTLVELLSKFRNK